eukprot:CAMPEP_0181260240 /NCGR_PEP_ID=MMETSP1097-20121128/839_1 /TAXON_ID=35684 /ORGANISM="Pseudopedinella elastica, Strain CCMP716" /LENGTH=171 /DNA_ID=CAMNT_0023358743 /DNA_START=187 /DNA_END=700 /DNA_ORIENTATION=+
MAGSPTASSIQGARLGYAIPLGVVETKLYKPVFDFVVFNEFRHRLEAGGVSDPIAGIDNSQINRIGQKVTNKTTVDFQIIHWQSLEEEKELIPAPKFQSKFEAPFLGGIDELLRHIEVCDRRGLSNLKAHALGLETVGIRKLADVQKKPWLIEGTAGQVDKKGAGFLSAQA